MKTYSNLTRQERIDKVKSQRRKDLVLVLENLSEDLNISAILRTAEGFGVEKVYIVYPQGKKPKLSKGVSSGATNWLQTEFFTSIKDCFKELKRGKFKIIGTYVSPQAQSLWQSSFKGKLAIVMGNEAQGISEEVIQSADQLVYLPMVGMTESFNVSVAAAIFLYEVVRQKERVTD